MQSPNSKNEHQKGHTELHESWGMLKTLKQIGLSTLIMLVAVVAQAEITYVHTDHLGSVVAESNSAGTVTSRSHYLPFGETLETPADDVGYTGHKFDTDLGLSYMQARYYDPVVGRFYSNDPVGFVAGNPHSFNRYAYANNNPYKYADPDGGYAELAIEAVSLAMGVNSLSNNLSAGNYGAAAVDALGIVADGVLAAAPIAPGVVSMGIQGSRQGSNLVQGFHGTKLDNVNSIKADGAMNPNAQGEIYISGNQADTFVHGADSSVGGAVSAQVTIDASNATSVTRVSVPGNPNTTLIKTDTPLPTTVDRVTIRRPDGDGGFEYD